MCSKALSALVAFATVVGLVSSSTTVASAAVTTGCPPGIGIALIPGDAAGGGARAGTYIVAQIKPGAVLRRTIRVCNGTRSSVRLALYANAAAIQGGKFGPVGTSRASNDLSGWTALDKSQVQLAPQQATFVQVTITVPSQATPGERYAVVYAELPATSSPAGGFAVVSRVGVREYIDVYTKSRPSADFVIQDMTAARDRAGAAYVNADVLNTGSLAVDLAGTLTLSHGPAGSSAGPFPAELGTTLAPGQREPVTVHIPKEIPAGPWVARLELHSGTVARAAEATIRFPAAAGTESASVKATNIPLGKNRHFLVPLALLLLLLLAIGFFLLFWKRRRRDEDRDPEASSVAAA